MSFNNNKPSFLGNALIGACCAILLSVPLSAYIASFLGDTYQIRVWVYGGFLLWAIAGAMTIFFRTYKGENSHLSIRFILLWFVSVWLWPLLILFAPKRE
ncbi:MAG: hypothetical protein J6V64_03855 [Burkholderiaceae bacterium]|nr:hypothetical protein [Burkholderiaceae bacterium]